MSLLKKTLEVKMNADISLNFIALKESSFSFNVFRRSTEDYEKKDDEYEYRLPYVAGEKELMIPI